MDTNQDGIWNLTEVHDFIKDYACLLHRNLTGNWSGNLTEAYNSVNYGVSARELELGLSRSGKDITTFKDFIMKNSVPKPKGKIDKFEIMEYIYEAVEDDD